MSDSLPPSADGLDAAPPPAAPPRWRRALLYTLSVIGVLALLFLAWGFYAYQQRGAQGIDPRSVSMDSLIDEAMARHYGPYDPGLKGWVQEDPDSRQRYLMRVVHRAKMEAMDESGELVLEAVYFMASGEPLGAEGMGPRRLGAFVYRPEAQRRDAGLIELAQPQIDVYTLSAVRPEDVRFESLSSEGYGWVVKLTQAREEAPSARFVTNLVLAPVDGEVLELARFPARASHTPEIGCARAAAEFRMAQDEQARNEAAARAARGAASAASGADEEPEDDEGVLVDSEREAPGTEMCSEASWTYKTQGQAEGLADLLVTGGGLVNGRELPKKTYKLIFDPKSRSYLVPDELALF